MKALNEFLNEGKTPKFNPKNLEDPNDMKMIDSLRKHAKNYGFKEVKNPEKWAKKNGYNEEGLPTVAMFVHPDDKENTTIVQVYTQKDQKYLEVSFYAWGGPSGNDDINSWTTDKYWEEYFGEEDE